MNETTTNRRPLHLVWDRDIVVAMAATNLAWGIQPCALCKALHQLHGWLRFEVSYNDRGEMDGLRAVSCDRKPGGRYTHPDPTLRPPAPGFTLGVRTDDARPGKVLYALRDDRTRDEVFACWFDDGIPASIQFHVGNAIAATYGDDEIWDDERINMVGEFNQSATADGCRICGQALFHHDRLVVRVAWDQDPAVTNRLRDLLVIACGPAATIPGPVQP
ncbi:hypothetical protein AB0A05_27230 [Streptomyces sp. NPDC046374]|uniref:hypothetical protein n=1 Tax=Streptomyces sp. NPDC046374 TaxID=3154917 RepID=UPI0033C2906E